MWWHARYNSRDGETWSLDTSRSDLTSERYSGIKKYFDHVSYETLLTFPYEDIGEYTLWASFPVVVGEWDGHNIPDSVPICRTLIDWRLK